MGALEKESSRHAPSAPLSAAALGARTLCQLSGGVLVRTGPVLQGSVPPPPTGAGPLASVTRTQSCSMRPTRHSVRRDGCAGHEAARQLCHACKPAVLIQEHPARGRRALPDLPGHTVVGNPLGFGERACGPLSKASRISAVSARLRRARTTTMGLHLGRSNGSGETMSQPRACPGWHQRSGRANQDFGNVVSFDFAALRGRPATAPPPAAPGGPAASFCSGSAPEPPTLCVTFFQADSRYAP